MYIYVYIYSFDNCIMCGILVGGFGWNLMDLVGCGRKTAWKLEASKTIKRLEDLHIYTLNIDQHMLKRNEAHGYFQAGGRESVTNS